ncbi:MAG: hypothetical protein JWO30_3437 [Fibrobacteres bacterium]|nr:hypothetical protein [Fibrobacterota bacterium]
MRRNIGIGLLAVTLVFTSCLDTFKSRKGSSSRTLPAKTDAVPKCLEFEPDTVEFVGTVYMKVFPGKPEYEDTLKGDEKDPQWMLRMSGPICINGSGSGDINDPNMDPVGSIQDIQLVVPNDTLREMAEKSISKETRLKGTLFHGITIHHRTEALLWVVSIGK